MVYPPWWSKLRRGGSGEGSLSLSLNKLGSGCYLATMVNPFIFPDVSVAGMEDDM
jgi:hypothetical protein